MNAAPVLKTETPQEAARRLFAKEIASGFKPEALHCYANAEGVPLFYRPRLKHPDGHKVIKPMRLNGNSYILGEPEALAKGKPLYLLPELLAADPAALVFITEGESCVDVLTKLGLVATTSGGATSADGADWSPLQGRLCIIWPDNDEPGRRYTDSVTHKLHGIASVSLIADEVVRALPEHGDVVDWIKANPDATADDITALPTGASTLCGAAILNETYQFIGRFVAYPSEHAHVAHALWIAHTHLMEEWDSTPRIAFLSPEPGSGKSRALEVTEPLVPSPVNAVNVSPAYIFRKIGADEGTPTLLYDEIDTVFGPKAKENEEIRGLLNAGSRKGACAGRCVVRGKEVFTEEIPAYCAVALAGLGGLPDTLLSRSIVIKMRRRSPVERVEPYRRRLNNPQGEHIGQKLVTWAAGVEGAIKWPDMPSGIEDRDADLWESLLAIADIAGSNWPRRAREAALYLVSESKQSTPSLGIQLLADTRSVFKDSAVLATETILEKLCAMTESPWGDLRGKPLTARGLGSRLRNYGIKPKTVRIGESTPKGYTHEDMFDAWARYLPPLPDISATSATSATNALYQPSGVADDADLSATNVTSATNKPCQTANVADVALVAHLWGNGGVGLETGKEEADLLPQPHNLEPAKIRVVTGGCTVASDFEGVEGGADL